MEKLKTQMEGVFTSFQMEVEKLGGERSAWEAEVEAMREKFKAEREQLRREKDELEEGWRRYREEVEEEGVKLEGARVGLKRREEAVAVREVEVEEGEKELTGQWQKHAEEAKKLSKREVDVEASGVRLAGERREWEAEVEVREKQNQVKLMKLKEIKDYIDNSKGEEKADTTGGMVTFVSARKRRGAGSDSDLDFITTINRAVHIGEPSQRCLADMSLKVADGVASQKIRYYSGPKPLPRTSKNTLILTTPRSAAARVTLPPDADTTSVLTLAVDAPSRVLSLTQADLLVSRDGMWSAESADTPLSQLRVCVCLTNPGSYVEILQ